MVKLIVAKGSNNVIGKNNDLIWHLPADMKFFTQSTKGNIVVMGRRNWDSIPLKYRPLSERVNVVITRNKDFNHPDCLVFNSLKDAIDTLKSTSKADIYIIGGGQIYAESLKKELVDEMLITFIDAEFDGDTWFPEINESLWIKELVLTHKKDDKNPYSFTVWRFSKKP